MSEGRRRFLRRARDLLGTLAGGLCASNVRADDARQPGALGAPVTGYGERSRFERSARWVNPARYAVSTGSCTPLGELDGVVTPSALHYERHHAGVPAINPALHRVLVHGLVQRPLEFTMDALRRFPSASRLCFLECSGNSWREWPAAAGENVQQTHGLTSCSEWTGVLLKDLLAECGIGSAARWIVAEGGDGARLTRSVPLDKCQDDVLLAYAQNGEALRPEQGYPVRLLVPGYEGSISVKWLTRIKVTDTPYYSREETSKYTDLMPDGRARVHAADGRQIGDHFAVAVCARTGARLQRDPRARVVGTWTHRACRSQCRRRRSLAGCDLARAGTAGMPHALHSAMALARRGDRHQQSLSR